MSIVTVIGAGPSALFVAKTILENSNTLSVVLLEQGKESAYRNCPADFSMCQNCSHCATLEGVGGAGLFSDGKLVLDLTLGGKADGINSLTDSERYALEESIKETFERFDGVSEFLDTPSAEIQHFIRTSYENNDLELKFYRVLHMGTQNLRNITSNFVNYLNKRYGERFKIKSETVVVDIQQEQSGYSVITNLGAFYSDGSALINLDSLAFLNIAFIVSIRCFKSEKLFPARPFKIFCR